MSITSALFTGITGLSAEGSALAVVGDNIANENTIGYKEQRSMFEDVLGRAPQGNIPGEGVRLASIEQIFTQGSLSNTGVSTDMALSGDGFFVVKGNVNGVDGQYYSRAGQFKLDQDGFLVNPEGLQVQGYASIPGGSFSAASGPIRVPTSALAPHASTNMTFVTNLDASAKTPLTAFDPQNPGATSNFSTSITTYDSLGAPHVLSIYYVKTGTNTWTYHVLANGGEVVGGTPGKNTEVFPTTSSLGPAGSLVYNADGSLKDVLDGNGTSVFPAGFQVSFNGAVGPQTITVNFGTPTADGGTGLDGVTQFASPSNATAQTQDGYAAGDLAGVSVDQVGVLTGVYTNGQKLGIARIAIAKFQSNEGLTRAGQNVWSQTNSSGLAVLGTAGTGGRAVITGGAIEQSNVDVAQQFVDIISHQRAFEADSKTITTADEMLQVLVNLKR